jgi:RNA polymerase sigma factor (sigma-70 family)
VLFVSTSAFTNHNGISAIDFVRRNNAFVAKQDPRLTSEARSGTDRAPEISDALRAEWQVTRAQRDELIVEHFPRCRFVAGALKRRLPPSVDLDDLTQAGAIGLMQAASSFDASRGIKFATYAEFRIRGAMLDYLRRLKFARRSESQRAEHLEPLSLDGFATEDREGLQDSSPAFEQTIIARDMAKQAFQALPRGKGAAICRRYFFRDETQTQIARDAGVSTPRINQVIAECVVVMRERLNARGVAAGH